MKFHNVLVIIGIAIILLSCNQAKIKKEMLPAVSGAAGEVMLVMDKNQWENTPGKAFRTLLEIDMPGLPQSEPMFNVINLPIQSFSEMFRIHRNIIYVNIAATNLETGIKVEYDKFARTQLFITMLAPNRESFMELYDKNSQKILGLLVKAEKERITGNYKQYSDKIIIEKLNKRAAINLIIPKAYTYDLDTNNFIWLSHETPEISQGIFIYYYEYKDTADFSANSLINKRDEILKLYVSGEGKGTYMTTELAVFPQYTSYNLNGKYTAELRGLWKVAGDFMGGPFLSISQFDEKRNRIVTVEGYVYAPKFNKREYMRQLEAILYSLEFVDVAKK